MQRTKMVLITVLVAALAVPSLWAQKGKGHRQSVKQIKAELQRQADTAGVAAICTGIAGGTGPTGYLAGTNKCSMSSPLYGLGNSLNNAVSKCSDSGGVEATSDVGFTVGLAGVPGSVYGPGGWGSTFNVGGTEFAFPVFYTPLISPSPTIDLALKRNEGVFGLEVSNPTEQTFSVVFHTTAGDVTLPDTLVGGTFSPDNQAQRFIAVCNTPAVTGVSISCIGCADNAATAIAQIRGDKFPGF